jgi:hypothetical protein
VRPVEATRPHDLPDPDGDRDARQHGEDEDVDHRHVPALAAEPRQRRAAVDGADHRHHDRREEDEEAPEDQGVHEPGDEALEELALTQHDRRLVLHSQRHVVRPVERTGCADDAHEEQGATPEEKARGGEQRRERDGACRDRYWPRTFLSSAVIAGTISCRSPITA